MCAVISAEVRIGCDRVRHEFVYRISELPHAVAEDRIKST